MRRILLTITILFSLCSLSGCGSQAATAGGGALAGGALTHTLAGAKEDLTIREAELIELYNRGVADGMKIEELDALKQEIYDTRLGRQGIETGEKLIGLNWNDPTAVGGGIGLIGTLAYALLNRKKLSQMTGKYNSHKAGAERFMIENPTAAPALYSDIGDARKANGAT